MNDIGIGARTIRSRRREQRLSVTVLASRVGVSEMDVLRWENGKASPTTNVHALLAEALNLPASPRTLADPTANGGREAADQKNESSESVRPRLAARRAKLSEEAVIEIKQSIEVGYSDRELGEIYGVNPATIWHIRKGLTWRRVQPR